MALINPRSYYIVDISNLKKPRLYSQEFGGIVDALEIIHRSFYNDFENTDIIKGKDAINYGLRFVDIGNNQWMGKPRFYAFPYNRLNDPQGLKSWRTLVRRKMREDFLKDLPNFTKFLQNSATSQIRTFRINNTGNIYYLVNSIPKYIKESYYKTVMDCIILHPDYRRVAFLKTKILECDEVEPIQCQEFFKVLHSNLSYLLSLDRYHPALIKYEKLGFTRNRYTAKDLFQKTERILPLRINL